MKSTHGCGTGGKHVIKTVYMPNEQMNTIIYENNNLRKQLEMQRIAFT